MYQYQYADHAGRNFDCHIRKRCIDYEYECLFPCCICPHRRCGALRMCCLLALSAQECFVKNEVTDVEKNLNLNLILLSKFQHTMRLLESKEGTTMGRTRIITILISISFFISACGTSDYNSSWGPSGGATPVPKNEVKYPSVPMEVKLHGTKYFLKPNKINKVQTLLGHDVISGKTYKIYRIKGINPLTEVAVEVDQSNKQGKYWSAYPK